MSNISNAQMLDGGSGDVVGGSDVVDGPPPEQGGTVTGGTVTGGTVTGGTVTSKFTFTAAQTAQINALAQQAGGYFSGETQAYIDRLAAGEEGDAFDTAAALNILVQQGAAKYSSSGSGSGSEDGSGSGSEDGSTADGAAKDAKNTIAKVLATYFNEGDAEKLGLLLYGIYTKGEINLANPDAIIFAIRDNQIYKDRFIANAVRVKNGFNELDPASYIGLEKQYRDTLSGNGMPKSFYDSQDDFAAMIGGAVSPAELQSRIQDGYRAIKDADPEVKRQMQELYGVSEGDLAAYFIDPQRMRPLLVAADYKRQADAARISAPAREQGFGQLDVGAAEEMAARGITAAEAKEGFTKLGLEKGLYTGMTGEESLNQAQQIGAAFGYDVDAQKVLAKRKQGRKAVFAGGGSFTRTTGATSNTTESGLNVAQ